MFVGLDVIVKTYRFITSRRSFMISLDTDLELYINQTYKQDEINRTADNKISTDKRRNIYEDTYTNTHTHMQG